MTDEEFIEQFENCSYPAELFTHSQHVKLAWLYLRMYEPVEALKRFMQSLKRFAASLGKTNLYHETITWAYIFLIHERMAVSQGANWEEFVCQNSDLFDWKDNILKKYYCDDTLQSEHARRLFVFPDKCVKSNP